MTEIKELIARLRKLADEGHEVPGARDAIVEAASALEALISRSEVMEEALREKPSMLISLSLNAPRGIYTASKTRHAPMWQQYRSDGYPVISTWIDEAGPGETQDHNDLWQRCIRESQMCEAMVVYREPDDVLKGAWLEMGVALGAGVPVFAVGCREFTIGKSGLLTHCDTVDEAMEAARQALTSPERNGEGDVGSIRSTPGEA